MPIQGLYNKHYYLYGTTNTIGDYGNVVESLSLIAGPIKCYATYIGGQKQVFVGKYNTIATHRLFCDKQSLIKSSYKIYILEDDQWYNILYIDPTYKQHHIELLLETINSPQVVEEYDNVGSSSSSSGE